jgi:hypothetical protein
LLSGKDTVNQRFSDAFITILSISFLTDASFWGISYTHIDDEADVAPNSMIWKDTGQLSHISEQLLLR